MLLHLSQQFCAARHLKLFAFHVHHGISPNADGWLQHCEAQAAESGAIFDARKVSIDPHAKDGIEASARTERYRALGAMCAAHQVHLVLTAHHQDDQAETLLLQLLRGSGVAGLSGMDHCNRAPALLGNEALAIARPLLGVTRRALLEYSTSQAIRFVEDESNEDHKYARNALRLQVMPILAEISPGFTERLARSAQHAQSAHRMLQELAQQDCRQCGFGDGLDISKMQGFSDDRIDNLLRFWLSTLGVRMPTTARLAEMRKQLFSARADAMVTVTHDGVGIHRYENRIYAERGITDAQYAAPQSFQWTGEEVIHFPRFRGSLYFEPAEFGLDSPWLKQQNLTLRLREGGERIKLAPNRPTRDIKSHYQTLRIPFWQRQHLPFVAAGRELLFAAGVGLDAKFCAESGNDAIGLRWEADAA
ncbi:tRNA(Ile)-lysidine synthase [Undibacterium terreum]|uniref:tRNA(Ile)-lysidine synthase n=1 Tax=Undibacterium terreum TaxID=1224302 RepID=A0A916XP83_9BURK|nr:tRNA lysidine(34) synthetase TilS [Undibacterium terreum]GGC92087.1 tRNA(Ile)-lysidine synthase [Undibacterium terreum]